MTNVPHTVILMLGRSEADKMNVDTAGPLKAEKGHPSMQAERTKWEMRIDSEDFILYDPTRAHQDAGDPDFKEDVENCGLCHAKAAWQAHTKASDERAVS